MNVLIIGFGVAGKYYLEILKKDKKIKKIYIFDKYKIKKNKYIKQIDFNINLIKKLDIKFAFIATPSNLHFKYSKILLQNSINLLIEKPFVLKLSDAKTLINLTKNKKVKCWVAFQNRFNLAIQKLKKVVNKKTLGNIFLVDCSLLWKRDKKYYSVSWRGKYRSDGGVLANQAIHIIDALVYIFGKIQKFNSILVFNKKKLQAEDLAIINFVHKSGTFSSLKATTRADSNYRSAMDIIGEKGRALVKGISLNTFHLIKHNRIINDKKNSEEFGSSKGQIGAMGNGHQKIIKEFLSKKINKSSKNLEIEKNLHVLNVLHSIYNLKKNNLFKIKKKQSQLGIK